MARETRKYIFCFIFATSLFIVAGTLAMLLLPPRSVPWAAEVVRQESFGIVDGYSLTVFRASHDVVQEWQRSISDSSGKEWKPCPVVVSSFPVKDLLPDDFWEPNGGQAITTLTSEGKLNCIYFVERDQKSCWIYRQW